MARRIQAFVVLLSAALLVPCSGAALSQQKAPPKKSADAFLSGAPFTLEQVLRFVRAIPPRRLKEAIQNRGLDFSTTPEAMENLKAAGATDELLETIEQRAKPRTTVKPVVRTPPPPPAAKSGEVHVLCAPAECEISVGGIPKGATSNGTLRIPGLRPGATAIDFKKAGYISSQLQLTIEAGMTTSVTATLEPDRSTRETFGAELFKRMLQALGGEAAVHNALWMQGEGSATIWARDGTNARWSILVRNTPDRALFQAKGGGGIFHEVAFTGSQFKTSKNLKGNDARELPTNFGLVREHQLAGLIARLSTPKFKMLANSATRTAGQEFLLVAEASTETISITLDNDMRPAQVKFGTATGLGSGIVTYSDYIQKGKTYFPQSMQIKPDATPHGIDVHFDRVELNPKLKDADYNPRGKPLPSLAQ